MEPQEKGPQGDRRCFIKEASLVAIGGVLGMVPVAAGVATLVDPLLKDAEPGNPVKVATLEALPKDGVPRKFPILKNRTDAWNKFTNVPVGAIYLRRTEEKSVQAYSVVCPHAGCFVDYAAEKAKFLCPCHDSTFKLDGSIDNADSPSPRGLDSLEVQLRNGNEIWVVFQNFQAGRPDKVPQT